jgi:hypothetical protein
VDDKLCFVQFIHPGGEPIPDNHGFKAWNRSSHKRIFLKNPGRYLHAGKVKEGEMAFWAEWEPESELVKEIKSPQPNGPRYIYRPYYDTPSTYEGLQNTDPFIFGEQFYYGICQQRLKNGRPTRLRYLARGSVVLFGSCLSKRDFVLDAVFVVEDWIDHNRSNFRKSLAKVIPEAYKDVTVSPMYGEPFAEKRILTVMNSSESWRLYFGATYEHPLEGMFSFFPCLPYEEGRRGFARPRIRIKGVITDNLPRGMKLNHKETLLDVKALWNEVAEQVEEQGLLLGIYTDIPRKV